jgi:hypothetical protein
MKPLLSYVHQDREPSILYIRNIMPDDMSIPLLAHRALSGWGFALFTRVRGMGILGSSLTAWLRNGCRIAWQTALL